MSNVFNIADRPGRDTRLLDQARDAAIPPLVDAFAMALGRFDDALFDRAERAGPSQMAFLDAMRELRRRREDIVVRFRAHLQRAWKALQEGQPLSMETAFAQGADDTLTLVTDQELESRLAVRNLASVIQRDCKPVLLRLDRRLGWIAGDVALDSDLNPIGPEHIGVAVHQAFSACDLTPEVRLVVIKLCERDLVPAIARIYAALDQRLGGGTAPEPAARRASRPEAARELEDLIADEEPGAPAWAARFLNRMAGVNRGLQAAHAGAQSPGFGEVPPGYASAPGAQGVLLEALHHLLQESRRGRDVQDEAPRPAHPQRDLSQREMLSVLSLLQSSPSATLRAAIGDTGESLSQRLKNEVLSSAMQLGVDPATARLAPVDEDAIDLVGMLFDVMLDERELEGRSRELIGRLVVPFVKVAMLDRRMFVQKTHPARKLLNSLAEACEGNAGESQAERALMGKVEEITDRLVAEFNENLAIFMTLEEEFREFLTQHRRRVEIAERRATETQRGQEKLEMARSRAAAELDKRLHGGTPLPAAIGDFLRQPWNHHLTLGLLREGEDGTSVVEALQLADTLLEEVAEAHRHIVGKPWLQSCQPALRKVFASVGLHGEGSVAAIDALHDTLQAVAEVRPELERALPELPQVALPTAPVAESPALDLGTEAKTEKVELADAERYRVMAVGTWLDFIDKDGKVQAGKLSWVSPISSRLLFVNRRGVRFCVASPEELVMMERLGRLRQHLDDGAFDTAMQGVIDRLDPQQPTLH